MQLVQRIYVLSLSWAQGCHQPIFRVCPAGQLRCPSRCPVRCPLLGPAFPLLAPLAFPAHTPAQQQPGAGGGGSMPPSILSRAASSISRLCALRSEPVHKLQAVLCCVCRSQDSGAEQGTAAMQPGEQQAPCMHEQQQGQHSMQDVTAHGSQPAVGMTVDLQMRYMGSQLWRGVICVSELSCRCMPPCSKPG